VIAHLRKSGGFIPGIRPGKNSADYIDSVVSRLTASGALYITAVCLLPEEQRSTQQKVVLFQTLSSLVSSDSEVSVLNILQSTSTSSLPNLQAFGNEFSLLG
jgi:preprotein translocase subunit SecY